MLDWLNLWTGCKAFYSYDDAAIGTAKLSVQSSVKYLITEISETRDLLALLLYHAGYNSKPFYFKSNKR